MKPSYPKTYSGATRKRLSQSEYYKLYPNAKKQVQNTVKKSKEKADYNKKTYNKEYKELKFLVETKKANDFTISMYVAIISGRKITPKMLNAIHNIMKNNSPEELEKKRLETERLLSKLDMVKESLHKANYHETYVWRSEDFLDSIEGQIRKWGNLSSKQKLALNKMYKRFNKKVTLNEKK
tara:strand:+ start:30 stop:572 length:543 start_codon:yes stop_codon:yes gene_type:complete